MTSSEIKLDKKDWILTKFGDVAIQQTKSVNRENTYLTKYVKGEHMGSEDIHLREWGELTDEYLGPAFIRLFKKGQVLYGSRRTYLKKVVVAPFEGITSNTTFVIEANEEMIDKRLLPYLMLSDNFTEHSVKHSKGSVNPYINWRDLAEYQFLLPPKAQQEQLADLLWALDDVLEKEREVSVSIEKLRDNTREILFTYGIDGIHNHSNTKYKFGHSGLINANWTEHRFLDVVSITSGQIDPTDKYFKDLYQIGSERIEPNTGRILELKTADESNITSGNYYFTSDHILYSKIRPYFKKVANPNFEGLCSADIYPLLPQKNVLDKEFLFHYMLTEKFTRKILRFQNRTGMPKVNREELGCQHLPIPDIEEQKKISIILNQINSLINDINLKLTTTQALQKSLINQIF